MQTISLHRSHFNSPLGNITMVASPKGLSGLWFEDQKHLPDVEQWPLDHHHPILVQAHTKISHYFNDCQKKLDIPIDFIWGTDFQQKVWHALIQIPYGKYVTYSQLAQHLEMPNASRAVGAAVGRNPISLIVPCHRVMGQNGQLTGYAGGLWRKTDLLQREGVLC
ncbi:MAG: methylated-DNA--[protein]-cysteine S-methyltransferase [Betaproteobacteria bacterium]|nr:methylated-DNA--[protein]-cysteine S-methyltransferase [Betaproteobacteria bacterium]